MDMLTGNVLVEAFKNLTCALLWETLQFGQEGKMGSVVIGGQMVQLLQPSPFILPG